jgi:hypothetical protein
MWLNNKGSRLDKGMKWVKNLLFFCRVSGIIDAFMTDMNKQLSKFNIRKKYI